MKRGHNEMPKNPDIDFEIELTQRSKMALRRRLRALHTFAAHGPSGRVLEFDPLDIVKALKVHLMTSGKSQSHLLVKIWPKASSISPLRGKFAASRTFWCFFFEEKSVLTLFDVCVAKPRLMSQGNTCLHRHSIGTAIKVGLAGSSPVHD